jgi:molybdopterin-guanine dinucleotide biosynthesis protein A
LKPSERAGSGASRPVGFAVAGGRSLRMGREKAELPWGESDLLAHALERLGRVCAEVVVLCGPAPRFVGRGHPVLCDAVSGAGAIGGLLAGLRWLRAGRVGLFLAVDLPLVPVPLLERLAALAPEADAVVPVSPGGPEPLCAAYSASCLAAVERRVAAGEAKMTGFWPDTRVRVLEGAELRAFGDPETFFLNANTPDDYERARRWERAASIP